jgi:hypothetical protein
MIAIEKMYGICDGQNIIFENVGWNDWQAIVPADFQDGTYVVEIYAKAYTGELIYYSAVLFMSDGRFVSLQPFDDGFYTIITEKNVCNLIENQISASIIDNRLFTTLIDNVRVKVKVSYEL